MSATAMGNSPRSTASSTSSMCSSGDNILKRRNVVNKLAFYIYKAFLSVVGALTVMTHTNDDSLTLSTFVKLCYIVKASNQSVELVCAIIERDKIE